MTAAELNTPVDAVMAWEWGKIIRFYDRAKWLFEIKLKARL